MKRIALGSLRAILLAVVFVRSSAFCQQQPDPDFDTNVTHPAYTDRHPSVLFDEAHNNFHTSSGRYKPFASLITSDGYRITPNRQTFAAGMLKRYEVLIIANALGAPGQNNPGAAQSAFTAEECDTVRDWIQAGGALLLITDHFPFGAAAEELGKRFGIELSKTATFDKANSDGVLASRLLFTRDNHLLGDHPTIRGRDSSERVVRVQTFTGQSLKGPAGSVALLELSATAVDRPVGADGAPITNENKGKPVSAAGRAQGVGLTLGKGRVVVLGEAAMLTAQVSGPTRRPMGMNVPGNDNRQFALNVMHWLSNLPGMADGNGGPVAAAPQDRPMTTAEIAAESEPSVALVKGKSGSGSGFLIKRGVIATNAHVIDDEFISGLEIRFPSAGDDKKGPYPARLLHEDTTRDLALLAVKVDLPPLRIAPSYTFLKGEDITVIGNPGMGRDLLLENAISRGVMSTRTRIEGQDYYQLGIALNPGNSGGPVFDSRGQVIGVATRKSPRKEALSFSIPVDALHAALKQVARQSTADSERVGSQHRLVCAVRGVSGGGAWYCAGIDASRAAVPGKAALKKAARSTETAIADLEREWFPALATEVALIRNDRLIASGVHDGFVQLADNFEKLRAAYQERRTHTLSSDDLQQMKRTHRQLTTSLYSTLKIELPDGLLTAFDETPLAQRGNIAGDVGAQRGPVQRPDPDFDTRVARPAYTTQHPKVFVDEAHHNFFTVGNRFKPFAQLIASDGYQVIPQQKGFRKDLLAGCDVLVIANAMGASGNNPADIGKPAFSADECNTVRDWINEGGSLLLISDQPPWATAAAGLAEHLGVEMSQGMTVDQANSFALGRLIFSRENQLLGDHPITRGRDESERLNNVRTFQGQSLRGPAGSVPFLKLADTAVDRIAGKDVPAEGRSQGLAFTLGKGRVVVLGEAGQLSAQIIGFPGQKIGMNVAAIDNRQMALNIMHWLSRLIGP